MECISCEKAAEKYSDYCHRCIINEMFKPRLKNDQRAHFAAMAMQDLVIDIDFDDFPDQEIKEKDKKILDWTVIANENIKLESDNRKLTSALEFYADKDNWCYGRNWNHTDKPLRFRTLKELEVTDFETMSNKVKILGEDYTYEVGGKRARQTLKEIKDE